MRVFAVHDSTGLVSAIVTAPDEGPSIGMTTEGGSLMTEVKVPADVRVTDCDEGEVAKLAEAIAQHRVVRECRLAELEPTSKDAE